MLLLIFILAMTDQVSLTASDDPICDAKKVNNTQTFDVLLNQDPIGNATHIYQTNANRSNQYSIGYSDQIKLTNWLADEVIQTRQLETYNTTHELKTLNYHLTVGKEQFVVKMDHSQTDYTIIGAQLETDEEQDIAVHMLSSAIGNAVLGNSETLSLIASLLPFGNSDEQSTEALKIPINSFDSTFLNLPYFWQANGYQLPNQFKLFDIEDSESHLVHVKDLGMLSFPRKETFFKSQAYELIIDDEVRIEVWFTGQQSNSACFTKYMLKDGKDTYEFTYNG